MLISISCIPGTHKSVLTKPTLHYSGSHAPGGKQYVRQVCICHDFGLKSIYWDGCVVKQ